MEIPNKLQLQQITFNHSTDINLQDFMNLYKKCTAKLYSFSVIDATLASKNPLSFRKFDTITSFARNIFSKNFRLDEAD